MMSSNKGAGLSKNLMSMIWGVRQKKKIHNKWARGVKNPLKSMTSLMNRIYFVLIIATYNNDDILQPPYAPGLGAGLLSYRPPALSPAAVNVSVVVSPVTTVTETQTNTNTPSKTYN